MSTRPCVMTIAGSDSGGGAGVQADLKGITSRGVHAAMAITAITAQNSRAVTAVHPLPDDIVEAQIDAVMQDLRPAAIKIGMLGTARLVRVVAKKIRLWKPESVVLDPVMIASSGARLLAEDAVAALRDELVPLATILTPNWPEAEALLGRSLDGIEALGEAGESMARFGAGAALFKGGHLPGGDVVDTLWLEGRTVEFRNPRIGEAEGHGTGCTLAAAIAAGLALGEGLEDSCEAAIRIVHDALRNRYAVGASKNVFLAVRPPS